MVRHRVRRAVHQAGHGAEGGLVRGGLAVHGHGEEGAAVVTAVKTDNVVFAGGCAGNLDRVFQRLGAGVGQHDLAVSFHRHHFAQLLGQLHVALVGHHRLAGVHQFVELRLDGLNHLGMSMADVQYADTAGEIDHAFAICVPDLCVQGVICKLIIGACCARGDVSLFECLQFFVAHFACLPVSGLGISSTSVGSTHPTHKPTNGALSVLSGSPCPGIAGWPGAGTAGYRGSTGRDCPLPAVGLRQIPRSCRHPAPLPAGEQSPG